MRSLLTVVAFLLAPVTGVINNAPVPDQCADRCRLLDSQGPTSNPKASFQITPGPGHGYGTCQVGTGGVGCKFVKNCKVAAYIDVTNNTASDDLWARWGSTGAWTKIEPGSVRTLLIDPGEEIPCKDTTGTQRVHVIDQDPSEGGSPTDVAWLLFECTACEQ